MTARGSAFRTKLWVALEQSQEPEAAQVRAALQLVLPDIESILSSAATSPTDFTLHDDEHSFRVAERMAEVIPATVLSLLAPYELALLLLSAYLHDIGMTPEQRMVHRHRLALLATPESITEPLTKVEHEEFQAWLDNYGEDIQVPLCNAPPTEEQLRLADKLVTHYARARHNDWSETWIRGHLDKTALGTYENWIDDLVALCRSHHEGYDELRTARFDPRPAGSAQVVVHLRYLACVLRVADVLDVDPERTPEVVFAHRDIAQGSLLYWRKDHATWITRNGKALVLAARPTRAAIEKAIRDTAAGIEAELQLVARIHREQPFHHSSFKGTLPHTWDWPEALEVQIHTAADYVYIDGAFRPNTQKLLQLLSGTQLYRNPLVAIRELLQNAFDAVKEEIALQRLQSPRVASDIFAQQHRVELRLEQRKGRYWILCTDDGIGMTQAIIRDYFLVSGTSRRHDIADLERRCRSAGFALGRTGEFGIGVLSYFMLADRVEIRTRRAHAHGGLAEQTGWYFETDGVGSFGELRRDEEFSRGSEVGLRLRRTEVTDATTWFGNLRNYLQEVLCVIPCTFELTSPLAGCENMTIAPGWVQAAQGLNAKVLSGLQPASRHARSDSDAPLERLPRADQERLVGERNHFDKLRVDVAAALKWHSAGGDLPNGLGSYRVHVPAFDLPGGLSAAFLSMKSDDAGGLSAGPVGTGLYFLPKLMSRHSWRGMATRLGGKELHLDDPWSYWKYERQRFFYEIDWTDHRAGQVTVDRGSLEVASEARSAMEWVEAKALALEGSIFGPSPYEAVNFNFCKRVTSARTKSPWALAYGPGEPVRWGDVALPAISSSAFRYQPIPKDPLHLGRKVVSVVPALRDINDKDHYDGMQWPGRYWTPDRVVALKDWRVIAVPLWEKPRTFDATANSAPRSCRFPPQWKHICCCLFWFGPVWNSRHPVFVKADEASRRWWADMAKSDPDPLALRDELTGHTSRAAAWFMSIAAGSDPALWQNIVERDPEFARTLWHAVIGGASRKSSDFAEQVVGVWESETSREQVRQFRPDGYTVSRVDDFETLLPRPAPSWVIEVPVSYQRQFRSIAELRAEPRRSK